MTHGFVAWGISSSSLTAPCLGCRVHFNTPSTSNVDSTRTSGHTSRGQVSTYTYRGLSLGSAYIYIHIYYTCIYHTLAGPLWEGCRESRRCSRDTYPESYVTKYTSILRVTVGMVAGSLRLPVKDGADKSGIYVTLSDVIEAVPLTVSPSACSLLLSSLELCDTQVYET